MIFFELTVTDVITFNNLIFLEIPLICISSTTSLKYTMKYLLVFNIGIDNIIWHNTYGGEELYTNA